MTQVEALREMFLMASSDVFRVVREILGPARLAGVAVLLRSYLKIVVSIGIVNRKLAVMLCVYGIKIRVRDRSMRDRRLLRDCYKLINES